MQMAIGWQRRSFLVSVTVLQETAHPPSGVCLSQYYSRTELTTDADQTAFEQKLYKKTKHTNARSEGMFSMPGVHPQRRKHSVLLLSGDYHAGKQRRHHANSM